MTNQSVQQDMKDTMSILQSSPLNEAFYKRNKRQEAIRDMSSLEGVIPMPNHHPKTPTPSTRNNRSRFSLKNQRGMSVRSLDFDLEVASPILHRTKHSFYSKNQRSQSLRDLCSSSKEEQQQQQQEGKHNQEEQPEEEQQQDEEGKHNEEEQSPVPAVPTILPRDKFYDNCLQSLSSSEELSSLAKKQRCVVYSTSSSSTTPNKRSETPRSLDRGLSMPIQYRIICPAV